MMDVGRHPNITLLPRSEVIKVQGEPGKFVATVKTYASYVNWDKCTGCGLCSEKCPSKIPSEFELMLGKRPAIYKPFPQAVPSKPSIDRANCIYFKKGKCRVCEKVCPTEAIDFDMEDTYSDIEVGAVIVATGIDYFDPTEASEFGYRRFKNVVTSFELERLLSAGGPTKGELIRFTDNKSPKRIAFINCVDQEICIGIFHTAVAYAA
jgi:heterodisulfide reductase subunit A